MGNTKMLFDPAWFGYSFAETECFATWTVK